MSPLRCQHCGREIEGLPYRCRYCGGTFCVYCHLPEEHGCRAYSKPGVSMTYRGSLYASVDAPDRTPSARGLPYAPRIEGRDNLASLMAVRRVDAESRLRKIGLLLLALLAALIAILSGTFFR